MKRLRTALLFVLGAAAVVAATLSAALVFGWGSISRIELEARYALPSSHFERIDGTRVHYTDEGHGSVVLILHASFMNLRSWDAVTAKLVPDYRVIRVDLLPNSLSGPDAKGDYSIERNVALIRGLLEKLNIHDVRIVGTSSGGIYAYRYAAAWPDEVKRLVLINAAGMPRTAATNPNRPRGGPIGAWLLSHYKSRGYWRENARQQFTTGGDPPEWFIGLLYDLNRRAGLREEGVAQLKQFRIGDPQAILSKITAPTMILWGMGNITVSHLEADVFEHWLTAAPSFVKKYPRAGHYPYIEIEPDVSRDLRDFLAGSLDGQLRVSRREPPGRAPPGTP